MQSSIPQIAFVNFSVIQEKQIINLISQVTTKAYSYFKPKIKWDLTVSSLSARETQQLNIKYRDQHYIPDVLSFPINENNNIYSCWKVRMLGDIVLCLEAIKTAAIKKKINFEKELIMIYLHGLLHLLGYNHPDQGKLETMNKISIEIINYES